MISGRHDDTGERLANIPSDFAIHPDTWRILIRGEIRAAFRPGHPQFELIRLAPIDLDGAITLDHSSAHDECETPTVPSAAKRLHYRRTR